MEHYTTIEQSKKLLELGVDQDTADMEYMFHRNDGQIVAPFPFIKDEYENTGEDRVFDFTPCWSVGALIELMPKIIEKEDKSNYYELFIRKYSIQYRGYDGIENKDIILIKIDGYNLIEGCYNMIIWLLENGYIKN